MRKIIEELHDPNLPYISKFTIYLFLASQQKTIHYASFFGHQVSVFSLKKKKIHAGVIVLLEGEISLILLNMGYRRTQSKKEEAVEERYSF